MPISLQSIQPLCINWNPTHDIQRKYAGQHMVMCLIHDKFGSLLLNAGGVMYMLKSNI